METVFILFYFFELPVDGTLTHHFVILLSMQP